MIPKILHQTARTLDIPENWRLFQSKLLNLHPDWTYKLWTDEDNSRFVHDNFPDFEATYNAFPKNIMRVDVIRYLILNKLGGVYMDMDYEMLRPFDLLQYGLVLPLEKNPYPEAPFGKTCNSFMAAQPEHPFFEAVIDDLRMSPPLAADSDPLYTTGPMFLTRIYNSSPRMRENAYAPPPELFNPKSPRTKRAYQFLLRQPKLYGIHHCDGTWRQYSIPKRFKSWIGRTIRRTVDI